MLIIGMAYASSGKCQEAIDPLSKFVAIHQQAQMASIDMSLETALYYLGECHLQLGQNDQAVASLEKAVEINRADADALFKLGVAYSKIGQHEKAIETYEKATLFVPNFTEAYQGMVESYIALGQPDYAAYARGMVAYSVMDYEGARVELENVIAKDANFAPAYIGLGLTYEQLGNLEKAKQYADAAIKLAPDSFAAQQLQGRLTTANK